MNPFDGENPRYVLVMGKNILTNNQIYRSQETPSVRTIATRHSRACMLFALNKFVYIRSDLITCLSYLKHELPEQNTVIIRINAAAFNKFLALQMRRLFEGGVYCKILIFNQQ